MDHLNIIGLVFGFIGSVILAFSLSEIVSMLSLLTVAHELDVVSNGEAKATGLDVHMKKSKKISGFWTIVGLIFIAVGFIFQLLAAFFSCK